MRDDVAEGPLVLLVGRDRPSRERYAECAAAAELRVEQAHNGCQALDKASKLRPDIIATDFSSSYGLNGAELCRRLVRGPSTKSIPILALINDRRPTELEEARAAGCTAVLVKPCSAERLLVEILSVLARAWADRPTGTAADRQSAAVRFLTRALQTALLENAELTAANTDLKSSAQIWADWYERALTRANRAEVALNARPT